MECNRDDALRSKQIAEVKFLQEDYAGAKKFALKARRLFPHLEGLSQLMSVLDVHVTAQIKLQCGEMNWYGLLQADPEADESVIRKQYRKLALVLHPDKNKAVGADSAFKYISQAWSVLSDKSKKAAYDSKVGAKASNHTKEEQGKEMWPSSNVGRSPPAAACPPPHSAQVSMRACQPQWSPATPAPVQASQTFWTACPACKMQLEYERRLYVDKDMYCPLCYKPFFANEVLFVPGVTLWENPCWHSGTSNAENLSSSSKVVDCPMMARDKGARKEDLSMDDDGRIKCNMYTEHPQVKYQADANPFKKARTQEVGIEEGCQMIGRSDSEEKMDTNQRDVSTQVINEPSERGGRSNAPEHELVGSINERSDSDERIGSQRDVKGMGETDDGGGTNEVQDELAAISGTIEQTAKHMPSLMKTVSKSAEKGLRSMNVPDADFYDFDKDRTEDSFFVGQIWACYDDDDGLPRYYAQVSEVYSYHPFKIQITWLEPLYSTDEISNWISSGFQYTCGEYKLGSSKIAKSTKMFSHMMCFEEGHQGEIRIYPRKGDVWALYKGWNALKSRDDIRGFDIIEVLTDYTDTEGVMISFLARIEGFTSIYQQQVGAEVLQMCPKDMRSFSHQVPVNRHLVDMPGIQEHCLELDPACDPVHMIADN